MATKFTLTNTARGLRGVHSVSGFVNLEPGETRSVELSDGEAAGLADYFTTDGKAPAAPDGDSDSNLSDNSVAELEAIAAAEGVDVAAITGTGANGRVLKSDIVAAIEAKRAAPAAPEGDALDDMSDDDLRGTVKAITGEDAPEGADRDALLALARGQ